MVGSDGGKTSPGGCWRAVVLVAAAVFVIVLGLLAFGLVVGGWLG